MLARRAATNYESLVKTRILQPLGMSSSAVTLTPALRRRCATGYDEFLNPVPAWDLAGFAPAGGLHSTVHDMLTYLEAETGAKPTSLSPPWRTSFAFVGPFRCGRECRR
jgi:CubicO group peptidase (beta-lactamase class C family)